MADPPRRGPPFGRAPFSCPVTENSHGIGAAILPKASGGAQKRTQLTDEHNFCAMAQEMLMKPTQLASFPRQQPRWIPT
jgi:hypothetical protein